MIFTIFGYPKTGKTLLFNLLTEKKEEISKFSVSTDTLHKAMVDVPDDRLRQISRLTELPPVYARIEYLDTGPLSFGEVKDSTFIDMLRRADGLIHVSRGFSDPEIPHPKGVIDPIRDIKNMEEELLLSDLFSIEKRLEKLALDLKKQKTKELEEENSVLHKLKEVLEGGKPLRRHPFTTREDQLTRGFAFITQKPLIHIVNADENTYSGYLSEARPPEDLTTTVVFCGQMETELLELDEEERGPFQEEYGLNDYVYLRDHFIKTSYDLMNLISFFTIGKNETRAWTISRETSAEEAAGKIHTDMQQGFIRAEVIGWQDFVKTGGFGEAREKGLLRLEGKGYVIQDGEIVHIRFNK